MPAKKSVKSPKQYSYESFTELLSAIENKETTKAYFLIKNGADVNATNENGRTPLMAAIDTNNLDMVKVLVNAGAKLEAKAHDGETAFLYACRTTNNVDVIKYLIDAGANIQARNKYNDNGLFLAAEYNPKTVIIDYLIKTGKFDINDQKDIYKYSPLMAAARFNTPSVLVTLLNNGADALARDKGGWYPIIHATINKYDDPSNLVILSGFSPQLLDEDVDNGPLQSLAEKHNNTYIYNALESLRYLCMYVEDSTENRLKTPTKSVTDSNNELWLETHKDLLDDINKRIAAGGTVPTKTFIIAVKDGVDLSLIQKMIPLCKNINATDSKGRTALHYCATNNVNIKLLKSLIDAGIDPSIRDKQGKTALDALEEEGLWDLSVDIGQLEPEELKQAKRLFAGKHTQKTTKKRLPKATKTKTSEWIENMLSGNDNPRRPKDEKQIQQDAIEFVKKIKNTKK